MADPLTAPLRLILDGEALADNWRALNARSGDAQCGAAVKADGYGLGAGDVVKRLAKAGCTQFFVAHWREAAELAHIVPPDQIAVLNGYCEADGTVARAIGAVPVLNTPAQIAAWRDSGGGPCHVMFDSGINRLGIGPDQLGDIDFTSLEIDGLMSHLASADEDSAQNEAQRILFGGMSHNVRCQRRSLANSAGIMLGDSYLYQLTRPGLSLYGGVARSEMASFIRPVVRIEARILQIRQLAKGAPVGYNATYCVPEDMPVATIALGYADGYLRAFSNSGSARSGPSVLPVIGRVSMDLVTLDTRAAPQLQAGDWVEIPFDLRSASELSGLSQYELLTGLGQRSDRIWT